MELTGSGWRCALVGPQDAEQRVDWFHTLEAGHDHVVYQADSPDSAWGRQCLRQADRILFATAAEGDSPRSVRAGRAFDLVLLHGPNDARPRGAAPWLADTQASLHSHVRQGSRADIGRLARLLTGRAVGLVLSGGGARGFAHIGVIRALREAGVPIDIAGGTSMGAIAAAGVALEWTDAEFRERMKLCFCETNPLGDVTLPLVSLTAGRRVTRRLRRHFGDAGIENLWLPYFAVSANLTTGRQLVHRHGPVWRALRASVAIPGLLPPVIEGGEVLVDGGTLNNFPVDTLAAMGRGPVIGSDAGRVRCVGECGAAPAAGRAARLLRKWRGGAPGIGELLMRAATVSSDARTEESRGMADLLFEPPVESFDLRDWKSFDRIVEVGYRHAADLLDRGAAEKFLSRRVTTV
jgi:NTE family protein